jgi:lipoteichoic acid synthase
MKFKNFSNYGFKYIHLSFSLIVIFWAISIFGLIVAASNGMEQADLGTSLAYKLLNDFWAGLGISLLFFPLYLLFFFIKKSIGNILIKVLFCLIIIGQFALVKYHLTTLVNLGADLLGYSLDDMHTTVTASESLSFVYFLPFMLFPLLFFGVNYGLNKFTNERQIFASAIILVIVFGSLKMIFSEATETDYQNKLYYLGADIYRYQQEKNIADAYNLSGRNDYPLLKPFQDLKDVLSPFFNIQAEKPNIVIIIVEGLGGEFVGKNTYRGFTPFLDSLITKSLYWENFVSNAGRTFGVLPSLFG